MIGPTLSCTTPEIRRFAWEYVACLISPDITMSVEMIDLISTTLTELEHYSFLYNTAWILSDLLDATGLSCSMKFKHLEQCVENTCKYLEREEVRRLR